MFNDGGVDDDNNLFLSPSVGSDPEVSIIEQSQLLDSFSSV